MDGARLMNAVSTWVAPEVGCEYCHNTDEMASDEKYGKNVARHMFEDARRAAMEAAELGAPAWRVDTVLALAAPPRRRLAAQCRVDPKNERYPLQPK